MLAIDSDSRINIRSTGRLSAKGFAPVIKMLGSSTTLDRYDRERGRNGRRLKFTAVQMVTIILWMEAKKLTFAELGEMLDGRGGQRVLANLGMPKAKSRYIRPSDGWISDFRNHEYSRFRYELLEEVEELIMSLGDGIAIYTGDSTPLEASRYSEWADYNPHYRIKMAKEHIIMRNGNPLLFRITNGNKGDNPELKRLLEGMDSTRKSGCFLVDGGYDSFETYVDVYLKTGIVMSGNAGVNAVIHREALWNNVVRRYNKLHRLSGFRPSSTATPDFIIRFLANHGEREIVGWFLRNLDIMRGKKVHAEHARIRHLCETVHRAMKRWVNLDVRGLHKRYVGKRTEWRMLTCQLLSMLFVDYQV